jgi:membrane protein DedA with SNARE-associated domain
MTLFSEAELISFFTSFAYDPLKAYGLVLFFMLACAVILPFPEELILLIAGLTAYSANHPDVFPPPHEGAEGVKILTMCAVCYVSVFLSDLLVYFMGRFFGGRIIKTKLFQARFAGERFDRMNRWFQQYGGYASGFFRFTPGFRFPGHLTCGFLRIPFWKFASIDGIAALAFVIPQVYLYATYGNVIFDTVKKAKDYIFFAILALVGIWLVRKFFFKRKSNDLVL